MVARFFVIEYDPINNCQMTLMWDLFINSGDMAEICGIRVKVQVIPSLGGRNLSSITNH